MIRGVRGAIQAPSNDSGPILQCAEVLMKALIETNGIHSADVAAVFFTVTRDLDAVFPAGVRSRLGWELVPFLCGQEIPVPGSLERVLRVLILFETGRLQEEIQHQYLGAAESLRPDLKDPRH